MRALVAILLTIMVAPLVLSQPTTCPPFTSRYTLEVAVDDGGAVEASLFMHPLMNWSEFLELCYGPDPDYWHSLLVAYIAGAFELRPGTYTVEESGVDNNTETVYARVSFALTDSPLYDRENEIMRFRDPLKPGGYLDEVHVRSVPAMYYAEPEPDSMDRHSATWVNEDAGEAPDAYSVYFKVPVKVSVAGLAAGVRTTVYVNNAPAAVLESGSTVQLYLLPGDVVVTDRLLDLGDTRYKLVTPPLRVEGPTSVTFRYEAEHRVFLSSNVPGAWASVDGAKVPLPYEDWWREGEKHEVEVPSQIPLSSTETQRTSYMFKEWSDGYSEPSRTIEVRGPVRLRAIYKVYREYLVEVYSDYGKVYGEGWYGEGALARVGVKGLTREGGLYVLVTGRGERKVFLGWTGDVTEDKPEITVVVNGPKVIKAKWKTQYYVSARTPHSRALGSGWYDEGAVATVVVESTFVPKGDYAYRFAGWYEDSRLLTASARCSFRVSRPVSLRAEWVEMVRVRVEDEEGSSVLEPLGTSSGWVDRGTAVLVKARPEVVYGFPANHVFCGVEVEGKVFKPGQPIKANKPLVLRVVRCPDYTPTVVLAVVGTGAVGAFFLVRGRRRPKRVEEPFIRAGPPVVPGEVGAVVGEEETRVYDEEEGTRVYGESDEET